jgi:hypothetical protein
MVLTTVFLVALAIMFSGGNSAEIFGSSVYLVTSSEFELIKPPSAVISEIVEPADLGVGDIVIFKTEDGYKSIGSILEKGTETMDDRLVMFFKVGDEAGESRIVFEEAIIAKATKTSRTMGGIINFAKSPAGVLSIAIIPCASIILWELMKPLFKKRLDRKKVTPVNKQAETPTFVPPTVEELVPIAPVEKPIEKPVVFDTPNPAAALKAYKQTLTQTLALDEFVKEPELFIAPERERERERERSPIQAKPVTSTPVESAFVPMMKKKPLSSVKLAEAIAAVNAQKKPGEEMSIVEKTEKVNQALAAYSKLKGEDDD